MKLPVVLTAAAAFIFSAAISRGQILLTVDVTSPTTLVISATGTGPVTSDSTHTYSEGFDLEGLFAPVGADPTKRVAVERGYGKISLTTGDNSSGPLYDTVSLDSLSEDDADLNIYGTGPYLPTQTFTFGTAAFEPGTSITVDFSGLTLSDIGYGVITSGYSGDVGGDEPPVAIGVYHVIDDVGASVPEPSTYALMLGGLALLGVLARRRRVA